MWTYNLLTYIGSGPNPPVYKRTCITLGFSSDDGRVLGAEVERARREAMASVHQRLGWIWLAPGRHEKLREEGGGCVVTREASLARGHHTARDLPKASFSNILLFRVVV